MQLFTWPTASGGWVESQTTWYETSVRSQPDFWRTIGICTEGRFVKLRVLGLLVLFSSFFFEVMCSCQLRAQAPQPTASHVAEVMAKWHRADMKVSPSSEFDSLRHYIDLLSVTAAPSFAFPDALYDELEVLSKSGPAVIPL